MDEIMHDATLPPVPGSERAGAVLDPMLRSIIDGTLAAGAELRVSAWAARLGVRVSAVDDAIVRMSYLGLVERDDTDTARLMSFTRHEARQELKCWAEMHLALISLAAQPSDDMLRRMTRARDAYAQRVDAGAAADVGAHVAFFGVLRDTSTSFGLRLAATAAAYRLRLSEAVLPQDPRATKTLHDAVLAAMVSDRRSFDIEVAFRTWGGALTGEPLGW